MAAPLGGGGAQRHAGGRLCCGAPAAPGARGPAASARGGRGVPSGIPAAPAVGELPVRRKQLRLVMAGCTACALHVVGCERRGCAACDSHRRGLSSSRDVALQCKRRYEASGHTHSDLVAITSPQGGGKTGRHAAPGKWHAKLADGRSRRQVSVQKWSSVGGSFFAGGAGGPLAGSGRTPDAGAVWCLGAHCWPHRPSARRPAMADRLS